MPTILKLLSAQGIFFLVAGVLSIFPFGARAIGDREVTYSEWWASGAGFQFLIASFGIGLGAIFLLKKTRHACLVYFSILVGVYASVFALNFEAFGNIESLISPVLLLGAIYWYLFHKQSVLGYFRAGNL